MPTAHPDIDPPHKALQLKELFRELNRSEKKNGRKPGFLKLLEQAETEAAQLETLLAKGDHAQAEAAFDRIGQTCTACHVKYRD